MAGDKAGEMGWVEGEPVGDDHYHYHYFREIAINVLFIFTFASNIFLYYVLFVFLSCTRTFKWL